MNEPGGDFPQSTNERFPPSAVPQPFIEKYGVPPILFAGLSLVVLFLLYQGIPVVITLFIYGFHIDPEMKLVTAENVGTWRLLTALSQIVLLLVPTILLAKLVTFSPFEFFRLKRPKALLFVWPLIGIFALQEMLQIYLYFQAKIPLPEPLEALADRLKEMYEEIARLLTSSASLPELFWVIFVIALVPALCEELLFRGLVQRMLEKGWSPWRAAVATGIIFGAYHLNPSSFIPLALLGTYLGYLAMRADSIWVPIAAHFYNNATACVGVYLFHDEEAIVTGNPDDMGTAQLLLTFAVFGVVFMISTYYFNRAARARTVEPAGIVP